VYLTSFRNLNRGRDGGALVTVEPTPRLSGCVFAGIAHDMRSALEPLAASAPGEGGASGASGAGGAGGAGGEGDKADLVLCIEVGEHVPLQSHVQLVRALASRVNDGGYLLFSAAPPGMFSPPCRSQEDEFSRGSALHKACRSPGQWREEIERHSSLTFDQERTTAARAASGPYLEATLMAFRMPADRG